MATANLVAGTVMNASAALLNDVARAVYTYDAQIPYLNLALQELEESFELGNIPVTDSESVAIEIPTGYDHISFNNYPNPSLPNDLIEPQKLWERNLNIDPYVPMTRVDGLPLFLDGQEISQFQYYVWEGQQIRFFPANQINEIKMEYIKRLFLPVINENSAINVINAQTFLEYRNAGLCAEFIGENKSRADSLNGYAGMALDRVTGIGTKGRQSILSRRRPFRSGFKRRAYF